MRQAVSDLLEASNAHCITPTVCSEIRVRKFSTGEEPVQLNGRLEFSFKSTYRGASDVLGKSTDPGIK